MRREDIKISHKWDDMFGINFTAIYKVEKKVPYYNRYGDCIMGGSGEYTEEKVENSGYDTIHYTTLTTLYVDLLTSLNKFYGTSYEVAEAMVEQANSFRNKPQAMYSNAYEESWELHDSWGGYELLHHYHYDDIPNCVETYGDWTKEELIELADRLVEFFKADPYATAKASLTRRWDMYDRIGVIYEKDENFA